MHLVIFEGNRWPNFAPLSFTRPVFSLRCGQHTLLEQQVRAMKPDRLTLWVRPHLVKHCEEMIIPRLDIPVAINTPLDDEPALLSSGRVVHCDPFRWPTEPCVAIADDNLVHNAYVHSPGLSPQDVLRRTDAWLKVLDLPPSPPQGRMAEYAWHLTYWNSDALRADAATMPAPRPRAAGPYHLVNESQIFLGQDVQLAPGVVLDATKGPIVIDRAASIGANAVMEGPCFIGEQTVISALAHIRSGTSIGPFCRIGGEVSNSIILGYSNKAHEGFIGDSYIGEWVNFGAGTTTSNLKNTYGKIRIRVGPREIMTERQFLGAVVGDHTKTAIGTRLMCGTYVGYCTLLAGSSIAPRYIPSFTYWTDSGTERYRLDKAQEVMTAVYTRRERSWSALDTTTLRYVVQFADDVERL